MATRKHNRGFLAAFGTIALLMSPCAAAQTQPRLNSNVSSVVLTARIPPSVRLRSAVLPPPEQLRQMLEENQQAAVLLLESQWTFASGQSVSAHGSLLHPPAHDAALMARQSAPPGYSPGPGALAAAADSATDLRTSREILTSDRSGGPERSGRELQSALDSLSVFSFLPRALPQSVSLLRDFLPQRGPRHQLDGLLIVAPKSSEPQVVLLTVTAL